MTGSAAATIVLMQLLILNGKHHEPAAIGVTNNRRHLSNVFDSHFVRSESIEFAAHSADHSLVQGFRHGQLRAPFMRVISFNYKYFVYTTNILVITN